MRTFLKENDISILKYLYHNNNSSIKNIAKGIQKSETSVRNSIKNINYFLEENNLSELDKIDKKYNLPTISMTSLHKFIFENPLEYSAKQRFNYLILELILTEKLNLNAKVKIFNVTRKTLSLDLEEIKKFLNNKTFYKDLYLEGIPWQGVFLKGYRPNITYFSIEFLLKLLIERENSNFLLENSNLNKLYYEYIPHSIEEILYQLTIKIFRKFDISIGSYSFNAFLATCIYCYLKQNETLDTYPKGTSFLPNNTQISNEYLEYFHSEEFLEIYPFFKKNTLFLAKILTRLSPDFLKLLILKNNSNIKFIKFIEDEFNFNFSEDSKLYLSTTLSVGKFKYEYQINSFNSSLNDLSNFDKLLIEKIENLLIKLEIILLEEDFILLLSIIKENMLNYSFQNKKTILILDTSWNCWLGNSIKGQLIKKFQNIEIILTSPYLLKTNDICKINPELILYTGFNFENFFESIDIRKKQINHIDIFKNTDYFKRLGF